MSSERRLESLTGLRALAAGIVLVSHLRWLVPNETLVAVGGHAVTARIVMQQGNVGVSFFFLLSGFVLMWSHRAGDRSRMFWGRRFGRIYPLHLVTWIAWIVLARLGILRRAGIGPDLASLFLVQSWIPNELYYFGVNLPTWSLSCEVFFYALLPFIALRLPRLSDRGVVRTAWVAGGLAILIPAVLYVFDRSSPDAGDTGSTAYFLTYIFPPTRLTEFVLGAALAVLVSRGRLRNIPVGWATAAVVGAYLVAGRTPRLLANVAVTLVPFLLLLLAVVGADLADRPSVWRHRVVRHLGEVSFAVFMVQYGVIQVLRPVSPNGPRSFTEGLWLVVVAVTVTMALAEALHYGLERPAERWFRRRFSRPDDAELAVLAE